MSGQCVHKHWFSAGLPNPNFRNQQLFMKKQELIRRFSPNIQERKSGEFLSKPERKQDGVTYFFRKSRIPLSQMFIISVLTNE
jgi:hypothetical protein